MVQIQKALAARRRRDRRLQEQGYRRFVVIPETLVEQVDQSLRAAGFGLLMDSPKAPPRRRLGRPPGKKDAVPRRHRPLPPLSSRERAMLAFLAQSRNGLHRYPPEERERLARQETRKKFFVDTRQLQLIIARAGRRPSQ